MSKPGTAQTARGRFIEENIGLAHSCVRRYTGRGIDYDDLLQTACLGLVKAANGFDPSRGLCFSTYAVPVILGEIRHLFRGSGTVRVSREMQKLSARAGELAESFAQSEGRQPRMSELAQLLGATVEETALAVCAPAAQKPASLSDGGEDGSPPPDVPVEPFDGDLVDRVALRQAVEHLPAEDRRLLGERYIKGRTQTVTAQNLGMTQVQVSRREKKILARLRELMDAQ